MTITAAWFVVGDAGIEVAGPFISFSAAQKFATEIEYGRAEFLSYDDPTIPGVPLRHVPEPQEMTMLTILRGEG